MTYEAGGETYREMGKYLAAWKRLPGGEWKIHRASAEMQEPSPGTGGGLLSRSDGVRIAPYQSVNRKRFGVP